MPKKLFRRYLPTSRDLRRHGSLRLFIGERLHDPNVWHLNRRSVAGGVAIGLFIAWAPIPLQMATAAVLALLFRVNLPLSVILVWITNPLTMAPMYWFCYRVGVWILGMDMIRAPFEPSIAWLWQEIERIWQPLLVGSVVVGGLSALAGYFLTRIIWRVVVIRYMNRRRRMAARNAPKS